MRKCDRRVALNSEEWVDLVGYVFRLAERIGGCWEIIETYRTPLRVGMRPDSVFPNLLTPHFVGGWTRALLRDGEREWRCYRGSDGLWRKG